MCYGSCPEYHIEIDAKKNVRLYVETAYQKSSENRHEKDSARMGYFTGKLSDSLFLEITDGLSKINIDTVKSDDELCCDGSISTLILYKQTHRKELKTMFGIKAIDPLLHKLYKICVNHSFKRSKPFSIEGSERPKEFSLPDPKDQIKFPPHVPTN